MHILFISSNYPYRSRPSHGTFVQELVRAIARTGTKCSVVRPLSIFHRPFAKFDPVISYDNSISDNPIQIWSPRYISASAKNLQVFNTFTMTQYNFDGAVTKIISKIRPLPDLLYGHFLYPNGAVAVRLGSKLKIPSIVAVGESAKLFTDHFNRFKITKCIRDFSKVCGVIAVSKKNKGECVEKLRIPEEKIVILPNGVDLSVFYPRNRAVMRNRFGFPIDKFIIAFTGHFDVRKGPHRLLAAVSGLDNIGLIFIGSGNISLESQNILFKDSVEHSRIPELLSAADIFVLPTLAEGCCNALIEALACGLPVVTSKGEFNDDLIDDNVGIRVDPLNIHEIRKAILELYNSESMRQKLSSNALAKVKYYNIDLRASKILDWLEEIHFKYSNS